ncbi:hypothetical protein CALCODRAFT_555319 [Calocera cornea HHB12733]|uniref:Uncharacterized protein n=1 Tax=Calocera cornea HHB12733 TaxID=1353952 RepID=A0A165G134_9BASI|nr:hypothetical protein CALCODRAFT_555319 [Calocera cornea HHB12733]
MDIHIKQHLQWEMLKAMYHLVGYVKGGTMLNKGGPAQDKQVGPGPFLMPNFSLRLNKGMNLLTLWKNSNSYSPSSLTSFTSSTSLPAALNMLHNGLSNVKLAQDIANNWSEHHKHKHNDEHMYMHMHKHKHKMENAGAAEREWKAKGKERAWEETGSRSRSAMCGMGNAAARMTAILVVHQVEMQYGVPALVDGIPLIELLNQGGIVQDTVKRPKAFITIPEDLAEANENTEAVQPAVGHELQPAVKKGEHLAPPTMLQLLDKHYPDEDLAKMTTTQFVQELQRIKVPAFEYGCQLRRMQLIQEQLCKDNKVHIARLAEHNQTWDSCVGLGIDWVNTHKVPTMIAVGQLTIALDTTTQTTHITAMQPVAPVSIAAPVQDTKEHLGYHTHKGGKKFLPVIKKVWGKYGPMVLVGGIQQLICIPVKVGLNTLAQNM